MIICVFLRVDTRLPGPLRGYGNILLVSIGQGCLIGEFGVSAFADSGTDKESSKVDHSIELPVQICFSYTRACASKEQIALFQ